jgi:hypothetical protein
MGLYDDDPAQEEINEFLADFEDVFTEDVETVMLSMRDDFDRYIFWAWSTQEENRAPSATEVEEQFRRWRKIRRDPGLKKRAEKILALETFKLARGLPVNGLMRLCICHWCWHRHEGKKAGRRGISFIETIYRANEAERIVKEGGGNSQKIIDFNIGERLGLKDRTGRKWKQRSENKSK